MFDTDNLINQQMGGLEEARKVDFNDVKPSEVLLAMISLNKMKIAFPDKKKELNMAIKALSMISRD